MPQICYGLAVVDVHVRALRCYGMRIDSAAEPTVEVAIDPTLKTFSCLGQTCLSSESLRYSGVAVEIYAPPSETEREIVENTNVSGLDRENRNPGFPGTSALVGRTEAILRRQTELLRSLVTSPGKFIRKTGTRSLQISARMTAVIARARALVAASVTGGVVAK